MRSLVVGWFSFEKCNVTAGDIMAASVACQWLEEAGSAYDIALAHPFSGGVDWREVDPNSYSHAVFVCGPFPYIEYTKQFLEKFKNCCLVGLDLSMMEPLDVWQPFDILIERDSTFIERPDIAFVASQRKVPIVGVILAETQVEYRKRAKHQIANDAIDRLVKSRQVIVVPIDTRLDPNTTNLNTAEEIESMIARMDLVVTTRLHGIVLAVKNGVPAIAIDAIAGGAKVTQQAKALGWEVVFSVDNLDDSKLQHAFDYCLSSDGKNKTKQIRDNVLREIDKVRGEFIDAIIGANSPRERIYLKEILEDKNLEFGSSYHKYQPIHLYWKFKATLKWGLFSLGSWLVKTSRYKLFN